MNWITFCTGLTSNKVTRIKKDPRTCIYLFDVQSYSGISLIGKTEITTDFEMKKGMWYDELKAHFNGPEDENFCILTFRAERYNIFLNYQNIYGDYIR